MSEQIDAYALGELEYEISELKERNLRLLKALGESSRRIHREKYHNNKLASIIHKLQTEES